MIALFVPNDVDGVLPAAALAYVGVPVEWEDTGDRIRDGFFAGERAWRPISPEGLPFSVVPESWLRPDSRMARP